MREGGRRAGERDREGDADNEAGMDDAWDGWIDTSLLLLLLLQFE